MAYIDAFVIPLPKKNLAAYKKLAQQGQKVWRKYGALEYRECVGEDLTPGFGVSFVKAIKPKRGETVVFSWIMYKSRAHRDATNAKVMKDPTMLAMCGKKMPFDCERMICGGFEVMVDG